MSYQSGIATSPADLLGIIKAFSIAAGWTVESDVIYKGSVFANVSVNGGDIVILGGTGQSGGVLSGACPHSGRIYDASAESVSTWGSLGDNWPVSYWLFGLDNPDMVFCVINYNGTFYQWLTFGKITKYGDWVGGEVYAASHSPGTIMTHAALGYYSPLDNGENFLSSSLALFWQGGAFWSDSPPYDQPDGCYLHCEMDGHVWGSGTHLEYGVSSQYIHIRHSTVMGSLLKNALSEWNSQTVLLPYYVFAVRTDGDKYSQIGVIEDLRSCRIDNYNPGDIITIGADKWMVFPWVQKGVFGVGTSSGGMGVAIRYDGP